MPTLLDHWSEARDRFEVERDNFKAAALEKHASKTAELSAWRGTVQQACATADATARGRVAAFTKSKKHLVRDVRLDPQLAADRMSKALVRCALLPVDSSARFTYTSVFYSTLLVGCASLASSLVCMCTHKACLNGRLRQLFIALYLSGSELVGRRGIAHMLRIACLTWRGRYIRSVFISHLWK